MNRVKNRTRATVTSVATRKSSKSKSQNQVAVKPTVYLAFTSHRIGQIPAMRKVWSHLTMIKCVAKNSAIPTSCIPIGTRMMLTLKPRRKNWIGRSQSPDHKLVPNLLKTYKALRIVFWSRSEALFKRSGSKVHRSNQFLTKMTMTRSMLISSNRHKSKGKLKSLQELCQSMTTPKSHYFSRKVRTTARAKWLKVVRTTCQTKFQKSFSICSKKQ